MTCKAVAVFLAVSVVTAAASEPPAAANGRGEVDAGNWFWGISTTNFHCKLEESESLIDRQVNGLLGPLMPAWKRPETFQDWGHDWKVWDVSVLVGRDFSPKWSGIAALGGTMGKVRNQETYYPLCLPHQTRVDFSRYNVCVSLSAAYYPFNRPFYDATQRSRLAAMARGIRPFLRLTGSYVHFYARADVRLGNTLIPCLFRQKQEFTYDLLSIDPNVGVEMPLSKKDSVSVSGGYSFFNEHGDEYNTPTIRFMYTHKFGGGKKSEGERDDGP